MFHEKYSYEAHLGKEISEKIYHLFKGGEPYDMVINQDEPDTFYTYSLDWLMQMLPQVITYVKENGGECEHAYAKFDPFYNFIVYENTNGGIVLSYFSEYRDIDMNGVYDVLGKAVYDIHKRRMEYNNNDIVLTPNEIKDLEEQK